MIKGTIQRTQKEYPNFNAMGLFRPLPRHHCARPAWLRLEWLRKRLQRGPATAELLAAEQNVVAKTIYRDLRALRLVEPTLHFIRNHRGGRGGGSWTITTLESL